MARKKTRFQGILKRILDPKELRKSCAALRFKPPHDVTGPDRAPEFDGHFASLTLQSKAPGHAGQWLWHLMNNSVIYNI